MTSAQQRAELQAQIWKIANDVRGSVDGWDFKQFVLGTLFYRFISENFSNYIEADDESINYAKLSDSVITKEVKDDAIKTKGYFIYPSQLFENVAAKANTNEKLNTDLAAIFSFIASLCALCELERSGRETRLSPPLMLKVPGRANDNSFNGGKE